MKYIITKDRIINLSTYEYEKEKHWFRQKGIAPHYFCWKEDYDKVPNVLTKEFVEKLDKNECKQVDTIEELCDEFVLINKKDKMHFIDVLSPDLYDCKNFVIYGAIWTDKGLIYVAKMNSKGELKLL